MTDDRILQRLAGRSRPVSAGDLAAELHEDTDHVSAELRRLHEEGRVDVVGTEPAGWFVTEDTTGEGDR